MSLLQSYYDLYYLFARIKKRYNISEWFGHTLDHYKFLLNAQSGGHYPSLEETGIVSQHVEDVNSLLEQLDICEQYLHFDPHNQVSGFSQISFHLPWAEARLGSNQTICLQGSFRIIEAHLDSETVHLICCSNSVRPDLAICYLPINQTVINLLSRFKIKLDQLGEFDLQKAINLLKGHIRTTHSTRLEVSRLFLPRFELETHQAHSVLNGLTTYLMGHSFTIVNTQQYNCLQVIPEGLFYNCLKPDRQDKVDPVEIKPRSDDFIVEGDYFLWVEQIHSDPSIIFSSYLTN